MKRSIAVGIAGLCAVPVLVAIPSFAESAADDLGRPKSVVEYLLKPDESQRQVLEKMVEAARRARFEPREPIQWTDGFFTAVRKESDTVEHRAVVWLDWRYDAPGKTLAVFVDYARFKKPHGSPWQRQDVTLQDRSDSIADLVQELLHAARF